MSPRNPSSNKEFKQLQAVWYKRLKKEGFDDIEEPSGHLRQQHHYRYALRYGVSGFASKEEYYRLAGQFLFEHVFADAREKMIWTLHAEGLPVDAMLKKLKSAKYKISRPHVYRIIKALATTMLEKAKHG